MPSKIKKGEMESLTHRRCQQIQCGYFLAGNCRRCQSCSSESYVLKKSCKVCLDCEGESGFLRWNDNTQKQDISIPNEIEVTILPKREEEALICPR